MLEQPNMTEEIPPQNSVDPSPARPVPFTEELPLSPPPPPPAPGIGFWQALILGVFLLAGGAGIGWFVAEQNEPVQTIETEAPRPAATTPEAAPSDEPVAAVAEALIPSMVQIDTQTGLGSGFVYEDGLILTAAHVVDGSGNVSIRFADGTQRQGEVIGTDAAHDIAVVSADTEGVPAARLALEDDLEVGQLAVAIGSPWGLEQTVTSGVVSAVSRPLVGPDSAQVLIQTDASINPGNSGGALANRDGEVIGVNIQIFTTTGANSGVGFAVPITNAYQFAGAIVAGTPIETAYLGVTGDEAFGEVSGALITEVVAGGAAEAGGLQVDDIVTAVDGEAVRSITDLAARVRSYLPGDEVTLDLIRGGETLSLQVVLGVRPAE